MPLTEPSEREDQPRNRPGGSGSQETTAADASDDGAPDGLRLVRPAAEHGARMWRIARDAGLDVNSPYAYALWCRDFAATSVIALDGDGAAVGFVTGYVRPDHPDTYFLWQVAVDASARGRGLAAAMLDRVGADIAGRGIAWLEATVTADNTASRRLFTSFARARGVEAEWTPLFGPRHFPPDAVHDPEDLVRIGPLP